MLQDVAFTYMSPGCNINIRVGYTRITEIVVYFVAPVMCEKEKTEVSFFYSQTSSSDASSSSIFKGACNSSRSFLSCSRFRYFPADTTLEVGRCLTAIFYQFSKNIQERVLPVKTFRIKRHLLIDIVI